MIRVFDTLSQKKKLLRPRTGKHVDLFVCGPTVYDHSHLGHARTYIAFDMIVKYLRWVGYNVVYLQNITDIDDKIIQRAAEVGEKPTDLARRFETEYYEDMEALGVTSVTHYRRATEHIPEIISQVERLLNRGYAYEIPGDGIYYDVLRFKRYGNLSGRTALQAEDAVSRIDESVGKQNKGDFALWKASKPGEPKWKSKWGDGRPGWHIEDTAITEKYFGSQYDIHGGARDLIFPHHEAEIAQMEAISGRSPLVRYWMHAGFLTVEGIKMSKSIGNFLTIRDFLQKYSARELRFLVLKTHYRSPMDYSESSLSQVRQELARIDKFLGRLARVKEDYGYTTYAARRLWQLQTEFNKAMEDDFNTPQALSLVFEVVKECNQLVDNSKLPKSEAKAIMQWFEEVDHFFGFIFWGKSVEEEVPAEIWELVREREDRRMEGNWQEADALRAGLRLRGWRVEDTPLGPKVERIKRS